jgi:hypothetical protein
MRADGPFTRGPQPPLDWRVPTEPPRAAEPSLNIADRFVTTAVETAGRAALFKAAELTADAAFPGGGLAVRVTKIVIDFRGALKTYEQGNGFLVNVPIADLPGREFAASLRIRVGAGDRPPGLPADLAIDYVSDDGRLDKVNVVEGADVAPANDAPPQANDIGPLLRHTQQLAARTPDHHLFGFRTAYLHRPTQTGWIVVQPSGEPSRCEAWFTYQAYLSVSRRWSEPVTTCPRCRTTVFNQHHCDVPIKLW